jgi:hypothetical protein
MQEIGGIGINPLNIVIGINLMNIVIGIIFRPFSR